jgi:hypothetical protein
MEIVNVNLKGLNFDVSDDGSVWFNPSRANGLNYSKRRAVKFFPSRGYMNTIITVDGKRISICQHILVALAHIGERPRGFDIDHIDGDRSHNLATNLRYLSRIDNLRAHRAKSNGTSKYRGVSWCSRSKRWRVVARNDGAMVHVGVFRDEVHAAIAWDVAVIKLGYLPEALNFPAGRA